MMWSGASYAAPSRSHQHGNFEFSVRNIVDGRSLLDDLADRFQYKIEKDDVNNGTASGERRSNSQPGLSTFGDRSVADALSSELSPQAATLLEVSTARADALSHVEDARIPA